MAKSSLSDRSSAVNYTSVFHSLSEALHKAQAMIEVSLNHRIKKRH